jgi:hypothetical protein
VRTRRTAARTGWTLRRMLAGRLGRLARRRRRIGRIRGVGRERRKGGIRRIGRIRRARRAAGGPATFAVPVAAFAWAHAIVLEPPQFASQALEVLPQRPRTPARLRFPQIGEVFSEPGEIAPEHAQRVHDLLRVMVFLTGPSSPLRSFVPRRPQSLEIAAEVPQLAPQAFPAPRSVSIRHGVLPPRTGSLRARVNSSRGSRRSSGEPVALAGRTAARSG